jgi:hypothetical protein
MLAASFELEFISASCVKVCGNKAYDADDGSYVGEMGSDTSRMAIRLSSGATKVKVGRNVLVRNNVPVGRRRACVGVGVAGWGVPRPGLQEANKNMQRTIRLGINLWDPLIRTLMFIPGV